MTPDILYDQLIGVGAARKLVFYGATQASALCTSLPRRHRTRLAAAGSSSRSTATPAGHAGGCVAVLLELDRVRPAVFDGVAEAVQRADAWVAPVGEDELARRSDADQLVVEDVRGHPDQLEIPTALADQLVTGGERDQVREPFERD